MRNVRKQLEPIRRRFNERKGLRLDEGKWVTINGTHVEIGDDGQITKGPNGIKEHYEKKSSEEGSKKASGKQTSGKAQSEQKPKKEEKSTSQQGTQLTKEDLEWELHVSNKAYRDIKRCFGSLSGSSNYSVDRETGYVEQLDGDPKMQFINGIIHESTKHYYKPVKIYKKDVNGGTEVSCKFREISENEYYAR